MQNVVKLLVKFPYYCRLSYLDSISSVREPLDSFRNQEGHLACPRITDGVDKDLCAVVLSLPPGVGPAKDDSVGLHPTKPAGLNPANSGYSQGDARREGVQTSRNHFLDLIPIFEGFFFIVSESRWGTYAFI